MGITLSNFDWRGIYGYWECVYTFKLLVYSIYELRCVMYMLWQWKILKPQYEWKKMWAVTHDFQQCHMCDQQRLRPACAYQPAHMRSLIWAIASRLNIPWILSYWLNIIWEFLSLTGGCTDSSESTLVKIPHCWKSHVAAQYLCVELVKENLLTELSSEPEAIIWSLNGLHLISSTSPLCPQTFGALMSTLPVWNRNIHRSRQTESLSIKL